MDEVLLHLRKKNKLLFSLKRRHERLMTDLLAAFVSGFALSAALIMAIGAQNLFVLQRGLQRHHIGPIVLFCGSSDAILIALGVAGAGTFLTRAPDLAALMAFGGVAFLASYAVAAFWRVGRASTMTVTPSDVPTLGRALASAAGFTFLNPHVYLDTVLLMGTTGSAQPEALRPIFVLGAAAASFTWFAALGYGARLLQPVFARPAAWRILDFAVGVIMSALAFSMLASVLGHAA